MKKLLSIGKRLECRTLEAGLPRLRWVGPRRTGPANTALAGGTEGLLSVRALGSGFAACFLFPWHLQRPFSAFHQWGRTISMHLRLNGNSFCGADNHRQANRKRC